MRVILVFDSSENGRVAVDVLEFMGKSGLSCEVYMLYRSKVRVLPHRQESEVFAKEGLVASEIVDEAKKRLESCRMKVKQVKIIFGTIADEVSKLEKVLAPHLVVVGLGKESGIRRALRKDECSKILSGTKTPTIVCREGFEISKIPELCECARCAVKNI